MSLTQITGKQVLLKPRSKEVCDDMMKAVGKQAGPIFDFYFASEVEKFDLYQLILRYKAEIRKTDHSPEHFMTYAQQIMGADFFTSRT